MGLMPMGREWGEERAMNEPLIHIINKLELTTGLKVCLDAGDIESAPEATTTWLDRSGNGYDFFLGTTISSASNDPTFNGVPGNLSASEYWSFDGGDYFRYAAAANDPWVDNCHKDDAKFSIIAWCTFANPGVTEEIAGTRSTSSLTGWSFQKASAFDALTLTVQDTTSVIIGTPMATPIILADGWAFCAVTLDETIGAGGLTLQINGLQESNNSTYVSPATTDAIYRVEIAARGNGVAPIGAGGKMGMIAMWEGTALTPAQLMDIFEQTRGRYGG